eukprot:4727893-Amphidinium_carterae.1
MLGVRRLPILVLGHSLGGWRCNLGGWRCSLGGWRCINAKPWVTPNALASCTTTTWIPKFGLIDVDHLPPLSGDVHHPRGCVIKCFGDIPIVNVALILVIA